MMSANLMDTAPGGETPQYESVQTVTKPTATQEGQLGGGKKDSGELTDLDKQKLAKGEKIAENVRYGQNISESGVGGETSGNGSTASQAGFGGTASHEGDKPSRTRRAQGYGEGSGVGG